MTWGYVAVGVGTVAAGYLGSQSAGKAADAVGDGADASAQVQWDMYDQSRKDQMPWYGTGNNALKQLAALNGVQYSANPASQANTQQNFNAQQYLAENPDLANDPYYKDHAWEHYTKYGAAEGRKFAYMPGAEPDDQGSQNGGSANAPDYSSFYNSPDYKFALEEGNRSVNAGLAARGLSNSGRAMKELTRYGQGMASQQLNTYRNALAAMAGVGQSTATNFASQGNQTAASIGNSTQDAADARASGYLGSSNAWGNALSQGVGTAAYMYGKK